MFKSALFLAALCAAPAALAVPLAMPHQGALTDASGLPLEGEYTLTFAIYDAADSTTPLWTQVFTEEVVGGHFAVRLGSDPSNPLPAALIDGSPRWVGLTVDSEAELPRLFLDSVPHALVSRAVSGGPVNASSISVNGVEVIGADGTLTSGALPIGFTDDDTLADLQCVAGEFVSYDGLAWGCSTPAQGAIDAADITSGTLDLARLPIGSTDGTVASGSRIHDALDITTGVLVADRIPALDAAKTTSGVFDVARIPDLDAAKITSGTLNVAQIPALDAAKIVSGSFLPTQIPNLDAAKITSGTLNAAQIPNLDAAKITSGVFVDARIPNLAAAKTTSGVFDVARIPNLDAAKITSGVLDRARLPALTAADVGAAPANGTGRIVTGGVTSSDTLHFSGAMQQITFWPNGWANLPTGWSNGPGPAASPNDGFSIAVGHTGGETTAAFLTINDNADDAIYIGSGSATCCSSTWRGLRVQGGGNAQLSGTLASGQGALYADVAENVPVTEGIEAGDVVAVSPDAGSYPESRFVRTAAAFDRGVVGVISDSAIMNMATEAGGRQPLALTGLVKVKVDASYGAIQPGDLLVSSPTPGHAMRADDAPAGTVIGKALEPLNDGTGRVLMLVMSR